MIFWDFEWHADSLDPNSLWGNHLGWVSIIKFLICNCWQGNVISDPFSLLPVLSPVVGISSLVLYKYFAPGVKALHTCKYNCLYLEYGTTLFKELKVIRELARKNIQRAQSAQKRQYEKSTHPVTINVGAKFKLDWTYQGPYRVYL